MLKPKRRRTMKRQCSFSVIYSHTSAKDAGGSCVNSASASWNSEGNVCWTTSPPEPYSYTLPIFMVCVYIYTYIYIYIY